MENLNSVDIYLAVFLTLSFASLIWQLVKTHYKKLGLTEEQKKIIDEAIGTAVDTSFNLYKAGTPEIRKQIAIDKAYEQITKAGLKVERSFIEYLVDLAIRKTVA